MNIKGFNICINNDVSITDTPLDAKSAIELFRSEHKGYLVPVYSAEQIDTPPLPSFLDAARKFAIRMHGAQLYGSLPYVYHLDCVVGEALSVAVDDQNILTALFFHDLIEDTSVSIDYIKNWCVSKGLDNVVNIVIGMTDVNKEPNYDVLAQNEDAWVGKLCDRLANVRQNYRETGAPRTKYIIQQKYFESRLYRKTASPTTIRLQNRLKELCL